MDSDCGRSRDAAAYVLGELRGQPLLEYRGHLGRCEQCQEDVEILQRAANSIEHMASVPSVRADQEPDEPEPFRPGVWAGERIAMVTAPRPPTLREQVTTERPAGSAVKRRTERAGGWWQQQVSKPALGGVVGLAVLALIVLILTKQGQSINYVKSQIAWQNGAAVLKADGSQGQLLVVGMPAVPTGERYDVWAIKQGVRSEIPLGAKLMLNRKGEGGVIVPGDIRSYLALAVYAEPRNSISTPHGTPYVVTDLRKLNKQS